MKVGDINIVETGQCFEFDLFVRQMPPTTKVRWPRQPRVRQNAYVLRFAEQTSVTKHRYSHAFTREGTQQTRIVLTIRSTRVIPNSGLR
jgi:hypothetical protein